MDGRWRAGWLCLLMGLGGCATAVTRPGDPVVLLSITLRGDRPLARYTTFSVRRSLPAGTHRLTRLVGVTAAGVMVSQFDVTLDLPFEARAHATDAIGRLELTRAAGASRAQRTDPNTISRVIAAAPASFV